MDTWTPFWWNEHWALRVLASAAASFGAGFIAGTVSRRYGRLAGALATAPTAFMWAAVAYFWWFRQPGLADLDTLVIEASIGNKLAATLLALSTIPVAVYGGGEGEKIGAEYGVHFDSRRFSLLGIRWFHYLWLPAFLHLLVMNVAFVGYYGLMWAKLAWQGAWDGGLEHLIPLIFTAAVYGTFWLIATGAARAYRVLAGFDSIDGLGRRALSVLGNGPGKLALAIVCQTLVFFLHDGLVRLLD